MTYLDVHIEGLLVFIHGLCVEWLQTMLEIADCHFGKAIQMDRA
jgi:hypothetical protein